MKKRTKKIFISLVSIVVGIAAVIGITIGCIIAFNRPKTTFDFSQKTGAVTYGASGFLYGFAEPDIPSLEMAQSIGVSTLSTKTVGGLQHPIGDAAQVADTFFAAGGKEMIVYTQDMYDTWYYKFDSLEQYHERVQKTVSETLQTDFADKVVYCIYNEMDNGQWFGDFSQYGNRVKTYEAWKETFALVRSMDADAKIGGPGYCAYNSDYIREFLEYCKAENCLPDTMIWHELGESTLYMWEDHFADYDAICQDLGIEKIPVCITEYGLMATNGIPGESVKWISRIEASKCEGCVAYWRLANNLSDVAADDLTPNSNWWAYHWYNEMTGETVSGESKDLFQSNMEKFLKRKSKTLKNKGFTGLATVDADKGKIQVIAGGSNRNSTIKLENLDAIEAFKNAKSVFVTAEYVDFKGLSGSVFAPKTKFAKHFNIRNGNVTIDLNDILYTQCYHLTVVPVSDSLSVVYEDIAESKTPMCRYEAEDAVLFGTATVQNNVPYAASNYTLVKAYSLLESGVEFTVTVPQDGLYNLDLIYGNGANNIKNNPDGSAADKGERTNTELLVCVDGEEGTTPLTLPSTIKDDYTDCVGYSANLTKGTHTIRFTLQENTEYKRTVSFDFLDVTLAEEQNTGNVYSVLDAKRSNETESAFWMLTDADGYYNIHFTSDSCPTALTLNGTTVENAYFQTAENGEYTCTLYLRRGLSSLLISAPNAAITNLNNFDGSKNDNTVDYLAEDFNLSGAARLEIPATKSTMDAMPNSQIDTYVDGISSDTDGTASIVYTAPQAGYYQVIFTYANNEEGGAHDYNVDLVERYITLCVNGEDRGNYYFRSTYSWETLKTKVVTVYLEAGENTVSFSNNGSYKFNGKTAYAPHISQISVSPILISEE